MQEECPLGRFSHFVKAFVMGGFLALVFIAAVYGQYQLHNEFKNAQAKVVSSPSPAAALPKPSPSLPVKKSG